MVVWYQIDTEGATKLNEYLQNALFMFAGKRYIRHQIIKLWWTECYAKNIIILESMFDVAAINWGSGFFIIVELFSKQFLR